MELRVRKTKTKRNYPQTPNIQTGSRNNRITRLLNSTIPYNTTTRIPSLIERSNKDNLRKLTTEHHDKSQCENDSSNPLLIDDLMCRNKNCNVNHLILSLPYCNGNVFDCNLFHNVKPADFEIPLVFQEATWIEKMLVSPYRIRMLIKAPISRKNESSRLFVTGPIACYENMNIEQITLPHIIHATKDGELFLQIPSYKVNDRRVYVRIYIVKAMLDYLFKHNIAFKEKPMKILRSSENENKLYEYSIEKKLHDEKIISIHDPIPPKYWSKFLQHKKGCLILKYIKYDNIKRLYKLKYTEVIDYLTSCTSYSEGDLLIIFGYYNEVTKYGNFIGSEIDPWKRLNSQLPTTLSESQIKEELIKIDILKKEASGILNRYNNPLNHSLSINFLNEPTIKSANFTKKIHDMLDIRYFFSLTWPWLFPTGENDITEPNSELWNCKTIEKKLKILYKWSVNILMSSTCRRFAQDSSFVFTIYDIRMRYMCKSNTPIACHILRNRSIKYNSDIFINNRESFYLSVNLKPQLGMKSMSRQLRIELSNLMLPHRYGPPAFFITLNPKEKLWYKNDVHNNVIEDDGKMQLLFFDRVRQMLNIILKDLKAIDAYCVFEWQKRGQPHVHILVWNNWSLEERISWYQNNITVEPIEIAKLHNYHKCYSKNNDPMSCIVYTKDEKVEYCKYGYGCKQLNLIGRPIHKNWDWIESLFGKVLDPPRNNEAKHIWPYKLSWLNLWNANMSVDLITNPLTGMDYISSYISKVNEDDFWKWDKTRRESPHNLSRSKNLRVVDYALRTTWASTIALPQAIHHICEIPLSQYKEKKLTNLNESDIGNHFGDKHIAPTSAKKTITVIYGKVIRYNLWDNYKQNYKSSDYITKSYITFVLEYITNKHESANWNDIMFYLPSHIHRCAEILAWFALVTFIPWAILDKHVDINTQFPFELDYSDLPYPKSLKNIDGNRWLGNHGFYMHYAIKLLQLEDYSIICMLKTYIDYIKYLETMCTSIPGIQPFNSHHKYHINDDSVVNYVDEVSVYDNITPSGSEILLDDYAMMEPISINEQIDKQYIHFLNRCIKHDLSCPLQEDQKLVLQDLNQLLYSKKDFIMNIDAPGGTGKSFLISYINKLYETNVRILAPTHQAANLIGGCTIQSKCPRNIDGSDHVFMWINEWFNNVYNLQFISPEKNHLIIIIDEASMTSGKMIIQIFRLITNMRDINLFSRDMNIGLIMVGDVCQNRPVCAKRYQNLLCNEKTYKRLSDSHKQLLSFKTDIMDKLQFVNHALYINKRMPYIDPAIEFIINTFRADNPNLTRLYDAYLEIINKNAFSYYRIPELCRNKMNKWISICAYNRDVEECVAAYAVDSVLYRWAYIRSDDNMQYDNYREENGSNVKLMYCRPNSKVIITSSIVVRYGNESKCGELKNNTKARLISISNTRNENIWYARISINDRYVDIKNCGSHTFIIDNETVIVPIFPLVSGRCITVHRSQGESYPAVHVYVDDNALNNRGFLGLFYTALTRCESPFLGVNIIFYPFSFGALLNHIRRDRNSRGLNNDSLSEKLT